MSQLTLNFQPSLSDRFPTLRAYIAHRSSQVKKAQKMQAADMDLSPSTLSRKLNPTDGDTQRLNVDDLEGWLASTGDAPAIIEYLASKYMDSDDHRKARVIDRAEVLLSELPGLLAELKGGSGR